MRKSIAILLVLTLLCGLAGCNRKKNTETTAPSYALEDMLLYHADAMARQIAMSTDTAYMQSMGHSQKMVALSRHFADAATKQPENAKMTVPSGNDFAGALVELATKTGTADKLECTLAMAYSTQFHTTKLLKRTIAVYLRYSERCHYIVVFTQLKGDMVSATAYPVFTETAKAAVDKYFKNGQNYTKEKFAQCCETGAAQPYAAAVTGQTVGQKYYADMATSLFANVTRLDEETLTPYTTDKRVISQALLLSNVLSSGIRSARVYQFPKSLQTQIDDSLAATNNAEALKQVATQQAYRGWTNSLAAAYGEIWCQVDAVVRKAEGIGALGAAAQAGETPVLVLLELKGEFSLILAIFPTEYNTYLYTYTCLPCKFDSAKHLLAEKGATLME